ncbi:MAG: protein-methionine-sulfoxide reductase catalytic subunit MsrP [Phycisphaerae bacterium]
MLIRREKPWTIPPNMVTPEPAFLNRRQFLSQTAAGAAGVVLIGGGCAPREAGDQQAVAGSGKSAPLPKLKPTPTSDLYPAKRNPAFELDRPVTAERVAARHNNYYEFTTNKAAVWKLAEGFEIRPWQVEVGGLVHKPGKFDIDELVRTMPLEERLYRFRCVEAWAMAVPWTGFPFKALIEKVQVKSDAKFVRMVTVHRPAQMPGIKQMGGYQWPYYEGLSMAEASNELTLLATGIYGHELPAQHGAPIRLVVPWKYGYKSIKSIVKIEFTADRPHTFWNDLTPNEYDFAANVNPEVPHPRWSQASERMIGIGERRPTLLYNGYGQQVAHLYA